MRRISRQFPKLCSLLCVMTGWLVPLNLAAQQPGPEVIKPPSNWPALPSWSLEELESIRSGKLEIGTALFIDDPGEIAYADLFEPLPLASEAELEEEEDAPRVIEPEFLAAYFGGRPAGYLVDPQGMLSAQEEKDRQGFLEYHAGDSEIDLYIYIFDKEQQVPPEGEIAITFKRLFSRGSGLTALVFYFMEAPERSLLVTSPEVGAAVPEIARKAALVHAKLQAQSKSEPASQLESFSAALAIRLYWMEQELRKARGEGRQMALSEVEPTVVDATDAPKPTATKDAKILFAFGTLSVASLLFGIWLAWLRRQRRKSYLFPETEVHPLLAAPHAAGVGAVIHFANATLPPSVQKEQVPDYLRKL